MAPGDAEIEIVSDPKHNQNGTSNPNPNPSPDPSVDVVVDVCSAAAYGDFEKLRGFVEREGRSLSKPDGNGYYALQWAALNNYPDIAHYIIEVFVRFPSCGLVLVLRKLKSLKLLLRSEAKMRILGPERVEAGIWGPQVLLYRKDFEEI